MSVLNALPGQTGQEFARLTGQVPGSSVPLARVPPLDTNWLDDGRGDDLSYDPSASDRWKANSRTS